MNNPANDSDLSEPLYRVVCAAIRHPQNAIIICGSRHYDSVMREIIRFICGTPEVARKNGFHSCEQGFINNKGEFMTREEAWTIARKAGQIIRLVGGQTDRETGTLYSENLY